MLLMVFGVSVVQNGSGVTKGSIQKSNELDEILPAY
jgi:hypothetical protein